MSMIDITEPLLLFFNQTIVFLPNLLAAIVLLIIGWVVGTVVGRVAKELLVRFKVDQYIAKKKPIVRLSNVFPMIFEWTIYLVFIQSAVQALGVGALAEFVSMIIEFIPGLVEAVIVVVVGYGIAEYVRIEIEKGKLPYSDIMGKVLFWLLVYVAIALALPLVGINPALVNNVLLIIVGAMGLGIAIAVGLGLKDVIAVEARGYLRGKRRR